MKTFITTLAIMAAFAMPYIAHAEEKMHTHTAPQGAEHGHSSEAPSSQMSGKIIGLTCYLQHGSIGKSHQSCAKECAEKGLPLGFLADDGKLYQIMGNGHADLKTTNAALLDYIEKDVTVVGRMFEKNNYRSLVIDKIKVK